MQNAHVGTAAFVRPAGKTPRSHRMGQRLSTGHDGKAVEKRRFIGGFKLCGYERVVQI
jgi:hypothetical protein